MGAVARAGVIREVRALRRRDRPLEPGRVVFAIVRAPHEGKPGGKARPAVVVNRREGRDGERAWALMGLTTNGTYADGLPRAAFQDWRQAELDGPGYIWGGRLVIVPDHDIVDVLGWISWRDALEVRRHLSSPREGSAFLAAVAEREQEVA
jgi:hypothetical protein